MSVPSTRPAVRAGARLLAVVERQREMRGFTDDVGAYVRDVHEQRHAIVLDLRQIGERGANLLAATHQRAEAGPLERRQPAAPTASPASAKSATSASAAASRHRPACADCRPLRVSPRARPPPTPARSAISAHVPGLTASAAHSPAQ